MPSSEKSICCLNFEVLFCALLRERCIQCCCNNETHVNSTVKLHNTESCGCVSDSMNVRLRRLAMALSLFSVSWNYPVTAKTSLDPPVFPTVLHVLVFLFLLLMTCLLRGGQLITHGAVHFHTRLSTQCTLMPR